MTTLTDDTLPATPRAMRDEMTVFVVMALLLAAVPFTGVYPFFVMQALCFALLACAAAYCVRDAEVRGRSDASTFVKLRKGLRAFTNRKYVAAYNTWREQWARQRENEAKVRRALARMSPEGTPVFKGS